MVQRVPQTLGTGQPSAGGVERGDVHADTAHPRDTAQRVQHRFGGESQARDPAIPAAQPGPAVPHPDGDTERVEARTVPPIGQQSRGVPAHQHRARPAQHGVRVEKCEAAEMIGLERQFRTQVHQIPPSLAAVEQRPAQPFGGGWEEPGGLRRYVGIVHAR